MFRRKRKKTTVFDLPTFEAKARLQDIANNIYAILESDKFAEIAAKIPIPVTATQKDIEALIKQNAPKKIKQILSFILEDNFENIIRIIANIFCEDYDFYKSKSLNQIANDLSKLTQAEIRTLVGFFHRAGH